MTSFQDLCYQSLKKHVPAGKVISYKNLAILIGNPRASRAVGNAMNKNPFAPQIPCHRVVKSDGNIGGFSASINLKIKLLEKEGIKVKNNKIVDFDSVQVVASLEKY